MKYNPYKAIQADIRNRLAKEERKRNRKLKRNQEMAKLKNVKLHAVCHFCYQVNEINDFLCKTYSCMFCHQPNNNPFYYPEERNENMEQPRDEKGRFIKTETDAPEPKNTIETPVKKSDFWEVEIDCVSECSKVQTEVEAQVKPTVKKKINFLMGKFKSIEWLAYLIGKKLTNDKNEIYYELNDIHLPNQKVSSGRVWDIDCPEYNRLEIVGVIHSHHGMGTGFSGTDHNFINGNHDLSLVISNNNCAGQVRVTTPCGSLKIISNVKIKHLPDNDMDSQFLKEVDEKICTPEKNVVVTMTNVWKGRKKKNKQKLTDSQKTYINGTSIKELEAAESKQIPWSSLTNCPNCNAIIDDDSLKCEFCHEDLI